VPDAVAKVYGRRLRYGPDYIIPAPFDPRLICEIPSAVAKAAMDSGVARRPIIDLEGYKSRLSARLDPAAGFINSIFDSLRLNPRRVVFAEGEEELVVRAASSFSAQKLGHPILIGRDAKIRQASFMAGVNHQEGFEIHNALHSEHNQAYAEFLYQRLQRQGYLYRDCQRLVNNDRNVFAACMLAHGHADAMVTGVTRNFSSAFQDIRRVLDPKPGGSSACP